MGLLVPDIAAYVAQAGIGTVATDIFCERMPAAPDNVLAFYSLAAPPPDNELDTLSARVEVWSRNASTKTAADKLDAVFNLLHRNHHLTLGDYYLYQIQALDSITNMDQDIEGRKLLKQTYEIIYRDNRTVS